jgi:hypothetical protein
LTFAEKAKMIVFSQSRNFDNEKAYYSQKALNIYFIMQCMCQVALAKSTLEFALCFFASAKTSK